jgi:hypothetical protein
MVPHSFISPFLVSPSGLTAQAITACTFEVGSPHTPIGYYDDSVTIQVSAFGCVLIHL